MSMACEEGSPIEDRPSRASRVLTYGCVTLLAGTMVFFACTGGTFQQQLSASPIMFTEVEPANFNTGSLKLEATNKYSERDGNPGQQYRWLEGNLLAEPYYETKFRVVDSDHSKEYKWEIYNKDTGDLEAMFLGHEFVHSFTKPDVWSDHFVMVNEYEPNNYKGGSNKVTNSASAKLYVRYVRREIRNLLEEDREEVLDAMALHWHVSQKHGTKLYGEDYRSMLTLLKYHLSAAGDRDCDHYHDGFGFLQHHAAITILFEQSLQAVNPKIALPYWDYVYDMEQFVQAGRGFVGFNNGELFTKDFFGSTNAANHIHDGRWAGLTMPTVDNLDSELEKSQIPHNPHGFLRSPWSNNDDSHVMRASTVCGADPLFDGEAAACKALESLTSQGSFEDWFSAVSYTPHGPVHMTLGGITGDCEDYWDAVEAAGVGDAVDLDVRYWRKESDFFLKNGWRDGYLDCTSTEGCSCTNYTQYQEDTDAAFEFLLNTGVTSSSDLKDVLSDDHILLLVEAICKSNIIVGDSLQSSSSWTPEFWTIHGTVERMYQLRTAKAPWDGGEFTWYKESWMASQLMCKGHFPDDAVLLGRDAVKVKGRRVDVTVRDFLHLVEPENMHALDYIYDSVDFEYCGADLFVG